MQPLTETARRRIRVGAWLVATAVIVVLWRTVNTRRLLAFVEGTNPLWLFVAVVSNLLIQPFGAMQWRSLLPPGIAVPRRRMLRLYSLTSIANNTTPSIIGHATGTLLLAAEPAIGREAALSVLALDQLAVGLVKVVIVLSASALLPLPEWMVRGLTGLAVLVGVMLVVAVVVARRTRFLASLRRPSRFLGGVAFAIGVKLAEAGAISAVQVAFGMSPSVRTVLPVLAATALGSVIPVAPANIGTYEAAAYGAYRFLGLTPEAALGIAVVQHVCQLLPAVGAGYIMLSLPRKALPRSLE